MTPERLAALHRALEREPIQPRISSIPVTRNVINNDIQERELDSLASNETWEEEEDRGIG